MRSLLVVLFLVITACGAGDGDAPAGQTLGAPATPERSSPKGGTTNCAITREQLASYLPRSLLGRQAVVESFTPAAPGRPAALRLDYGEAERYRFPLTLRLGDLSTDSVFRNSMRHSVLEASDIDASYDSVERRTIDGIGAIHYAVNAGRTAETLTILANDLYLLLTHEEVTGSEQLLDALAATDLLAALERDCSAVVTAMPTWLSAAGTVVPDAPAEPPAEDIAVIDTLPGCDEILPPSTVADICGVAATKARPTSFETTGQNCNRYYSIPGESDGLIFLLTNYRDSSRAVSALKATAGGGDNDENLESLPDLGQGGERYLQQAMSPTYTVRFASHGVLVELRNAESPLRESQYCMSLDQVEAIGRTVDRNLAGFAR